MPERIESFSRAGLTFDVRDQGPLDGEPIVLLHGFPQDARSWDGVAPLLHARGYRTIAPDQRGYSPDARPRRRRDYRQSELVADTAALIDRIGRPVHVVGHDWGAVVAWATAARHPHLVRSLTAVSVPHPAAFVRALGTSLQLFRSWYMLFYQLPWLPERLFADEKTARRVLRRSGQPANAAARDAARLADRAAVRGGLNWYRALSVWSPREAVGRVPVPTLMVWSDGDFAIGRSGPAASGRWVTGPFRFETLPGVSHWIPDEAPEALAELVVEHLGGRG
ncbi:alpha/beta fold hydrolase [Rhodococcus sp. NPDC003382]